MSPGDRIDRSIQILFSGGRLPTAGDHRAEVEGTRQGPGARAVRRRLDRFPDRYREKGPLVDAGSGARVVLSTVAESPADVETIHSSGASIFFLAVAN